MKSFAKIFFCVWAGWCVSTPLHAATVATTIAEDEYNTAIDDRNPSRGCSLREAVKTVENRMPFGGCRAEGEWGHDAVLLMSGSEYTLTLGDTNSGDEGGDLDIRTSLTLRTNGPGRANINGGFWRGLRDGIFEIHRATSNMTVIFDNIEIQGSSNKPAVLIHGGPRLAFQCSKCFVHDNDAGTSSGAGAIFLNADEAQSVGVDDNGSVYLFDSSFFNNMNGSGRDGGAISVFGNTASTARAHLYAENTTFGGNSSSRHGGAFYAEGNVDLYLSNVTITRNVAEAGDAGGIYLNGSQLMLRNSILSGNTARSPGATATNQDCAFSNAIQTSRVIAAEANGNSILGTNSQCNIGQFSTNAGDILTDTPGLDDFSNGIYLPLPASIAVGHGQNCQGLQILGEQISAVHLSHDQRGASRPNVPGRCDIGAIETGCGNRILENDERCDDGNANALDGCSATCAEEGIVVTAPAEPLSVPFGRTSVDVPLTFRRSNVAPDTEIRFSVTSSEPSGVTSSVGSTRTDTGTLSVRIPGDAAGGNVYYVSINASPVNASNFPAASSTFRFAILPGEAAGSGGNSGVSGAGGISGSGGISGWGGVSGQSGSSGGGGVSGQGGFSGSGTGGGAGIGGVSGSSTNASGGRAGGSAGTSGHGGMNDTTIPSGLGGPIFDPGASTDSGGCGCRLED